MKSRRTKRTVQLTMAHGEALCVLALLDFIEKRREAIFGPTLIDSSLAHTARALETALPRHVELIP